jgi:hypothetical protein
LPAKSVALKNSDGVTVKTFSQLDPQTRSAINTFISTVVARKHLESSWAVVAPQLRAGYTRASWARGDQLPVIPYPGVDTKHVSYFLDYASTTDILLEVGLAGKPGVSTRQGRQQEVARELLDAALDAAGSDRPVARA